MADEEKKEENTTQNTELINAVMFDKYGREEVLEMRQIEIPECPANHVLLKIHAASLNAGDYHLVKGTAAALGFKVKFPGTLGQDFSGEIVKLGEKVDSNVWKVGDMVSGHSDWTGSFREYCPIHVKYLNKKPQNITHVIAAAAGSAATTAYNVTKKLKLKKEHKILLLGGSGGVGLFIIQMVKQIYEVSHLTVTSSQVELCTKAGADRVINYREEKWEEVLKGEEFDILISCVEEPAWEKSLAVMKKNSTYLTICMEDPPDKVTIGAMVSFMGSVIGRKFKSLFGGRNFDFFASSISNEASQSVYTWIAENKIQVFLDEDSPCNFDIDTVKAQFKKSLDHKAHGKIAFQISKE